MSEVDLHHAEQLLFDIAGRLRRVPYNEHTKDLHLRALSLKRDCERCRRGSVVPTSLNETLSALDRSVDGFIRTRG